MSSDIIGPNEPAIMALGGKNWYVIRTKLVAELSTLLYGENRPVDISECVFTDAALAVYIGGMTVVADWLSSSQEYFPCSSDKSPLSYSINSCTRAVNALRHTGWSTKPIYCEPTDFGNIFKNTENAPFKPNPIQEAVISFVDEANKPYLMIIEAAMGDGKTEAALYAIDRALGSGIAGGFYIALPTQATGDAMFNRVIKDYLAKRQHHGSMNIQLVHGGSFLSKEFEKLQLESIAEAEDRRESKVVAETWFTPKKQALLAPLGVGTIDQSLLGVLQTKHWFVRLYGLAGKVVVFDEVHAYDVYMCELLKRLISWLKAIGSTVILLSATLPNSRRRELLEAWNSDAEISVSDYPRVTVISESSQPEIIPIGKTEDVKGKEVQLCRQGNDFADLAKALRADLPDGGCATVICNTVNRAQEAYRVMSNEFRKEGWLVMLLHARMPARWRKIREKRMLKFYGKSGNRPRKIILVGTSLLEQSLDYDADWMASEICPVDLLLQRMGRLWRHVRYNRPATHARFYVLCDEKEDMLPIFPEDTSYIYEPYILLRTSLALREVLLSPLETTRNGYLIVPKCIDKLVNSVYDDPEPTGLSEEWLATLRYAECEMNSNHAKNSKTACDLLVPAPKSGLIEVLEMGSNLDSSKRELFDDDDPRVHASVRAATRLGASSVSVICYGETVEGYPLAQQDGIELNARELLGWSIAITNRAILNDLIQADPPDEWRYDKHLRFYRRLDFVRGETSVGRKTLRLSRREGLIIDKAEDAGKT